MGVVPAFKASATNFEMAVAPVALKCEISFINVLAFTVA
jgi:hypothetical protein